MRMVVDDVVARAVPGLPDLVRRIGSNSTFDSFDPQVSPERILATVIKCRPEIVVVDRAWLAASSLLSRILADGGCPAARCVLGATSTSDALRIQAVRRGFFDIVDVTRPANDVLDHVREIHGGTTRLQLDRLWTSVGHLTPTGDVARAPSDPLDLEIVELLAVGLSDREIAAGVHLSLQAVRNRVSAMLERSGCVNRTQLGWMFNSQRLVDLMMFRSDSEE